MAIFKRLPGYRRTPYGLELKILKKLPWALAFFTAVPILLVLLANGFPADPGGAALAGKQTIGAEIFAIALAITGWTATLTVGLGCVIVWIMKGPAYVADAYELIESDRPRT